jgi:pyruvate formate lyase activating enzyme
MEVCIFDIKRFAVHDGPGIRSTVFLKGCPLDCRWCHNPEGISAEPETVTEEFSFDGVTMKREIRAGRWMEVEDLMDQLERDRIYMEESGGGISFSGGEPLQQADALFRLLELARERGLHTTVDTSGYTGPGNIKKLGGLADLILFDLKTLDEGKHRKYTGVSNRGILENLAALLEGPAAVRVRIPLVGGFNDGERDISALVGYLKAQRRVPEVDLLPYHRHGTHKYRRFLRENRQDGLFVLPGEQVESVRKRFREAGISAGIGG